MVAFAVAENKKMHNNFFLLLNSLPNLTGWLIVDRPIEIMETQNLIIL